VARHHRRHPGSDDPVTKKSRGNGEWAGFSTPSSYVSDSRSSR
jgi:hypothetical protein